MVDACGNGTIGGELKELVWNGRRMVDWSGIERGLMENARERCVRQKIMGKKQQWS